MEIIHHQAARALQGTDRPGYLQLVTIHPADSSTVATRFAVGQVEDMATAAIESAEAGFNVYVEARTVANIGSGRGKLTDTRGVFALVVDADADKGKAGTIKTEPSLLVETSPGNRHAWFFLDRALTAEEAKPIGEAIRAGTGADSATGVLTQPYRLAGTPNYPSAKKAARGRVVTTTGIVAHSRKVWTKDNLLVAFPPVTKAQGKPPPAGWTGLSDDAVTALAAERGADRSEQFFRAVKKATAAGMTPNDLEEVMRQHPHGCAEKYLQGRDRLGQEIERAWSKEKAARAPVAPTYPDNAKPVEETREAVERAIREHLDAGHEWDARPSNPFTTFAGQTGGIDLNTPRPPVRAIKVTTGVGKTRIAARLIAEDVKRRRAAGDRRPFLYAVPRHKLGDEVAAEFRSYGITARVFRGREAPDPDRLGKTMCDDLNAVRTAIDLGAAVSTSCCSGKNPTGELVRCRFFETCSYQQQTAGRPDVWIVAHQLLFQTQAALGEMAGVFIDESFWEAGTWSSKRGLVLDEVENVREVPQEARFTASFLRPHRIKLARALRRLPIPGGIERRHLVDEGLTAEICTEAIAAEWKLKKKTALYPGMPPVRRREVAQAVNGAKHIRALDAIWKAARDLLRNENPTAVSGRLWLDTTKSDEGLVRVVKTRGVKAIAKQWDAPTFIMDATLPDIAILKVFYPRLEIVAEIDATLPHVTVRQLLGAPVSSNKLGIVKEIGKPPRIEPPEGNRNIQALRRAILYRHLEVGRQSTLVIAQKAVAEWLKARGLPARIAVEHFNNVAGLDRYKDVRLLISLGRTLPTVLEVEAKAGALTGLEPVKTAQPAKGPRWYAKALLGIHMRDGTGYGIDGERHPDPTAEAVRWQIAEGEVIQAIGRARGVNRTPSKPLTIEVWADLVLPLTVDEAVRWDDVPAGAEVEMMAAGVALESPTDMAACWPEIWETAEAARDWRKARAPGGRFSGEFPIGKTLIKGIPREIPSPLRGAFSYRPAGRGQQMRGGWFDPRIIANPGAWLEARLGPLASFDLPRVTWLEPAPTKRFVLRELPLAFPHPCSLPLRSCPRVPFSGGALAA